MVEAAHPALLLPRRTIPRRSATDEGLLLLTFTDCYLTYAGVCWLTAIA